MNSYDEDIKPTYIKWEDVQSMKVARDLYEELNPQTATEKQMEREALQKRIRERRKLYEEQIIATSFAAFTPDDPYGHVLPRKKRKPSAPRPKKALLNMLSCLLDKDE